MLPNDGLRGQKRLQTPSMERDSVITENEVLDRVQSHKKGLFLGEV